MIDDNYDLTTVHRVSTYSVGLPRHTQHAPAYTNDTEYAIHNT